jgi:hypothetical protein
MFELHTFHNDDAGFWAWYDANDGAFFLTKNVEKSKATTPILSLHKVPCRHFGRTETKRDTVAPQDWTKEPKHCAPWANGQALRAWAKDQTGSDVVRCQHC